MLKSLHFLKFWNQGHFYSATVLASYLETLNRVTRQVLDANPVYSGCNFTNLSKLLAV